MRVATRALGSDFVYSRHLASVNYVLRHLGQTLRFRWLAGMVNGNAPMYDRFALGNSETLRGWDKYALAPLGGGRIVHGSVEYRYRLLEAFYDIGSIWDRGQTLADGIKPAVRQSVGVGIRKDALQIAMAFPMRGGHIDPVFLAGVNF
jgi:outer membrane protein assembly factor BamA